MVCVIVVTEAVPVREGDLLAGKYRVERVLGSGGMGIVVSAIHEQLETRVAIKFVRDEALGNDEAVQRFLREARAAVKLKSEHAARVVDVGILASGAPYMVMEYLEGSDLAAVLEQQGTLAVESAAEWIVQACEAIAEAHAMGIVHRDIKPQNLFLARTVGGLSKIKVLDFGVSKSLGTSGVGGLTRTRAMLGSPLYMSPEQMRSSREVDARSDVWALGVVLYELLTRHWPFEAESMPELCLKVVTDAPTPIGAYRADIPQAMIDVIERCLEKDPAKRFANAAEVASALEPIAPPGSRVVAERARLAMGASTQFGHGSPLPAGVVSGTHRVSEITGRAAPTPAAWDSNRGKAAPKRNHRGLWVGLGVATILVAAVGAMALRDREPDVVSPPSVSGAALRPPSIALAPASVESSAAVPSSVPPPTVASGPSSVDVDQAPSSPPIAPSISAVPVVTIPKPIAPAAPILSASAARPGAPHPGPSAKGNTDDDIPSYR